QPTHSARKSRDLENPSTQFEHTQTSVRRLSFSSLYSVYLIPFVSIYRHFDSGQRLAKETCFLHILCHEVSIPFQSSADASRPIPIFSDSLINRLCGSL